MAWKSTSAPGATCWRPATTLIDLIHTHPFLADGGPNMQFNVIFPRAHTYRVWVQFQRLGVVNTVYFDVPVEDLH